MSVKPKQPQIRKYPISLLYDWKKAELYNYTKRYNRRQWAWEFLRRNPEYQKDWLTIAKQHFGDVELFNVSKKLEVIHNPQALSKWGLSYYIHPRVEHLRFMNTHMGFFPIHGTVIRQRGTYGHTDSYSFATIDIPSYNIKRMALGVIDIHLPLGPQFKNIRKQLGDLQRDIFGKLLAQGNKDQSSYRLYLRHLDALADPNITKEEIINNLYRNKTSKTTTYHRNERVALELSNGHYRQLI